MTYSLPKLSVSQSLDQHEFLVATVLRELFDRHAIEGRPVDAAVHEWYRRHTSRVRSMLRHEEPIYTACAIIGEEDRAMQYEQGEGRERYLRTIDLATKAWHDIVRLG